MFKAEFRFKNSKLKRLLKPLIILIVGIIIGIGLHYFFTNKVVNLLAEDSPENYNIARYLNYFESSLDSLHKIKGNPVPGDWLYDHDESGQSMQAYIKLKPMGKTPERYKLYLQALGEFDATEKAILILTADYLRQFYNMHVELLDPMTIKVIPKENQRNHMGYHQLNARYILNKVLKPTLPEDAAAYIAFTNIDLYPSEDYNYVFGLGSLKNRVGVYSIARFGDPNFSKEAYDQCLKRTLKVAAHELGHLFSMKHCVAYECVMNGSNHLEESDFKPHYLCPKDMFKVCWNLEIDEQYRFQNLINFWAQLGFKENADFYRQSLLLLKTKKQVINVTFNSKN